MILSGDYIIAGLLIYSNRNTYCNFTILRTVTGKMLLTSRLRRAIIIKIQGKGNAYERTKAYRKGAAPQGKV